MAISNSPFTRFHRFLAIATMSSPNSIQSALPASMNPCTIFWTIATASWKAILMPSHMPVAVPVTSSRCWPHSPLIQPSAPSTTPWMNVVAAAKASLTGVHSAFTMTFTDSPCSSHQRFIRSRNG